MSTYGMCAYIVMAGTVWVDDISHCLLDPSLLNYFDWTYLDKVSYIHFIGLTQPLPPGGVRRHRLGEEWVAWVSGFDAKTSSSSPALYVFESKTSRYWLVTLPVTTTTTERYENSIIYTDRHNPFDYSSNLTIGHSFQILPNHCS